MIEFKFQQHGREGVPIIDVWVDGVFKAVVYPNETGKGIRVASRYFKGEPECEPYEEAPGVMAWEFKEFV